MIQVSHPFWQVHIHKLLHFPKQHRAKMTMTDNGRDNIGTYNSLASTKDYSFVFNEDLKVELVLLLAFINILNIK